MAKRKSRSRVNKGGRMRTENTGRRLNGKVTVLKRFMQENIQMYAKSARGKSFGCG